MSDDQRISIWHFGRRRRIARWLLSGLLLLSGSATSAEDAETPWPPAGENVVKVIQGKELLRVPESVMAAREKPGAAEFTVAEHPPVVTLAFHSQLGTNAAKRRLWSSWGDICVADDGKAYCGIGDHGNDVGGDARCFVYCWDPQRKVLEQVVDMNRVVPPQEGQPAWSKIHAKIDAGPDGMIYFSCTLNDGNRAKLPTHKWNDGLPGGQLYQFDPKTRRTVAFASLPARRCTATSLLDRQRNVWWCNLEAGEGNALYALDLKTRQPIFQAPDGSLGFNRNFTLARDGSIYFNGTDSLMKWDPKTKQSVTLKAKFENSPGMRCSTGETRDGHIYGVTHSSSQLFRYSIAKDELTMLGPNWLSGSYTAVCELSPDEKYLYFLPGSHGGAFKDGTPIVRYEIASGRRDVLAFLAAATESATDYVPAGTYGIKLSADGKMLYGNFNGHPSDRIRPKTMKPNGFGLCAFAAIQLPD